MQPHKTRSWRKLQDHHKILAPVHMRDLFDQDTHRFEGFSLRLDDLLFDFSKNRITAETMELLRSLAEEMGVVEARDAMFQGRPINVTEGRSVLHVALRMPPDKLSEIAGVEGVDEIPVVLEQMRNFVSKLHDGEWKGATGKPLTQIVNIGIGGSDLGPVMVTEALRPYWQKGMQAHFVSNVDGTHIAETLKRIDAEETLFIVASKTFSTQETLTNAHTARKWLVERLGSDEAVSRHFVAVSTNEKAVTEFGILPENMFRFWDWVGGRYSLWSSIGLSIACTIGMAQFDALRAGAHDVDEHFRTAPLLENIPVVMALLGIWYRNFFGFGSTAVLPYDQYLHRFPAYLQQADMESNGKSVTLSGEAILGYDTGAVVWGEPGTNGQHAFYQLLHQGTTVVPADFLAPAVSHNLVGDHHEKLLANFLAQTEALMKGRTTTEAEETMLDSGVAPADVARLAPHKTFEGNRPTNTLFFGTLDPRTLGRLVALYEHKIFVQGVVWGVNSFDQWGVELGKQLAGTILTELKQEAPRLEEHDSSTRGLMGHYARLIGRFKQDPEAL